MISFLVFLLSVIQNIRGIYSKRLKSEVQFCFQSDIWKDFFARNHQRKLFNLYHDLCKKRQRGRVRKSRQKHIKFLKTKGLFPYQLNFHKNSIISALLNTLRSSTSIHFLMHYGNYLITYLQARSF